MKIRNGFVSNSSSSSFIVLLPNKPQNEKDLKKMMFPNFSDADLVYGEIEDVVPPITVESVCQRVFSDIINGQKEKESHRTSTAKDALMGYIREIDEDSIVRIYRDSYHESTSKECNIWHLLNEKCNLNSKDIDYEGLIKLFKKEKELYAQWIKAKEESEKKELELMKIRGEETEKMYQKFLSRYPHHKFQFILEYGDRHGEYILETGYIFRNVPHITISNH